MLSLLLLSAVIGISALVGYVTYKEDTFRGQLVPFKQVSLVKWLQSDHHWHSFGHFFLDMSTTFVSAVTGAIIAGYAHNWGITSALVYFIGNHPIGSAFLAMVPSTLLTLYVEIVVDGHWRAFVGKDKDARDFLFDLFTHIAGGVAASMLIAALYYMATSL